ncbi:c-type cytochrome [Tropicimonas sediminicola]|uniref:Cytochrome c553 n=1 Tax=Tropicimonas sediminicola TaxID=1031541 RepID=A0A239H656_9RHOB|nr:c-type cytochrome [Tropicimonas sediminicola]SNS76651.1 Cytochrome c553 [Tropicimonas sediminicola]
MSSKIILSAPLVLWGLAAFAEGETPDASASETPATATASQDVDLAAAEQIFKKSCRACHGNKAQGAASYPKLSDKEPDYLAEKLERYRAGEKFGPNSILMIQNAKKLSDADIANLSVYIATAFD